ncbi:MAG: ribonuclease H-like domain-containing protein [Thaumarchaeota archaeon]|nr:ribonuclease H-like domain-containing protein [Nitrososphaerota archaeon]
MSAQSTTQAENLAAKLAALTKPANDIEESLLASATYDGDKRKAILKFYDHKAGRFWLWQDNTGHRPYCVTGDTLLLGDNAPIREIATGSHVLGMSGEVEVEDKSIRSYHGDMIEIGASGILRIRITPEHPVLVARSRGPTHGKIEGFDAPRWELPSNLQPKLSNTQGDYLMMPIATGRYDMKTLPLSPYSKMRSGWLKVPVLPLREDTAWLLGVYVAEGSPGGRRGAVFSLNKSEKELQNRLRQVARRMGYGGYLSENGPHAINLCIGGHVLSRALEDWCGRGAQNKKIPDFILFHRDTRILRCFLEGYLRGDGSKGTSSREGSVTTYHAASSTSKLLVLQLQQAFARIGIFAGVKVQHKEGEYAIEGRKVRQREAYTLSFVTRPRFTRSRRVGNFFYLPIRRINTIAHEGMVYNIQTSDNTYLVNNVVVHNCFTRLPMEELGAIRGRKDVIEITEEERADLLNDTKAKVRKIVTTDPLAIGGGNDSIRDIIKAWEADIKYYENYAYDLGLRMGTYYKVSGGKVIPVKHEVPERVNRSLEEVTKRNPPEFQPYLKEWAELLSEPLSEFRRVALDIEVDNEEGRLPDTDDPKQPVIAVSFYNDVEKSVYLLKGDRDSSTLEEADYHYELFEKEADLLRAVLSKIMDYPVVVTFNGDDFDLRYLQHRGERLGIIEEENPIQLERVAATLKHGIHIDLYQFFRNRSIQVYAFSNKYTEHTLNGISEALLGQSKIEFEGEVGDLPLAELAKYCLNDSKLTYELTSLSGSVVMKLLLVISRIGKMPMNDVSRLGVSNWIRSMLFFEHRRLGALIPRQDELTEKGGGSTTAIIKGKKYKGGFVIEPKPGAYFDVSVLDFASLYPSLIKVHNLSYETVNCTHPECKVNKVPDTSSWVCTKRKGVVSLVTGSLRDLRVAHYKPLTKDGSLPTEDRELYNVVTQGLKVFLNACFTGDTFIVTPRGIKNVKEIGVGDEVVNVNPETLRVEIDKVVEVQAFPYVGDLYHFKDKRFVDLMVTPNHRMLTLDHRKSSNSHTLFRTAEEVYNLTNMAIPKLKGGLEDSEPQSRISLLETAQMIGARANFYPDDGARLINWFRTLPPELRLKIRESGKVCKYWSKKRQRLESHYSLPARDISEDDIDAVEKANGKVLVGAFRSSKIPARFDAVKFASLCGWYVSEGSPKLTEEKHYENGNFRGRSVGLVISQGFGRGNQRGVAFRGEIRQLLKDLGLPHVSDGADNKYFQVSNSTIYEWFLSHCYDQNQNRHDAFTKRIPRYVFESRATMKAFLDAVYKGDGSKRGIRYSTQSVHLAEDLVVLTTMLGSKAKMYFDGEIYRVVYKNVSSKLTSAGSQRTKHVDRVPYNGMVYCVTTEKNHTVIAGRNGRFVHVGQSYGVLGFETFAFYCLPVAEATAALGRDAITRTIAKCEELGIEVLYGDTDSLFLRSPSRDQISTVTRWADKDLGVELDLDKVYRYVAFSSRKKNYFGVLPDGTVDIKGMTGKKSQTPDYLKKIFYETLDILSSVKSAEDFERARASTRELLTRMISDLKGKKVPVQDLAFTVLMGKPTDKYNGTTPQHVRAAKQLEERGKEIKAGEIIAYVKTKNPPYVKPAELARADEVDADKYIEYAHSMFDQLLDALDFSFDEIMGATTLDLFWSA